MPSKTNRFASVSDYNGNVHTQMNFSACIKMEKATPGTARLFIILNIPVIGFPIHTAVVQAGTTAI